MMFRNRFYSKHSNAEIKFIKNYYYCYYYFVQIESFYHALAKYEYTSNLIK